jgi:hypothetical protein
VDEGLEPGEAQLGDLHRTQQVASVGIRLLYQRRAVVESPEQAISLVIGSKTTR